MKLLSGMYSPDQARLTPWSEGDASGSVDSLRLSVLGRLKTPGGINQLDEIAALWCEHREKVTEHLGGQYILLLLDEKEKSLFFFHDRFTSPLTLYYMQQGDQLYYSTSLKKLIVKLPAPRSFEDGQVAEFLQNGFIYSEKTLVKGIFKLKPFCALRVQGGKAEQFTVSYPLKKYGKEKAKADFKPLLDRSIESCFTADTITLPLSGGYDSNYILYIADQKGNRPINAYSIGGRQGTNELPAVKKNLLYYPKVKLHEGTTSSNTLQAFPDMVWRLEGSVFQYGIFLQYELARNAAANGVREIICGECADQVFNKYFQEEDRIHPSEIKRFSFKEYPYIMGSQLVLKKSAIMLNSFGIEALYPYLSDELVAAASALREENGIKKQYHIKNCRECLPPQIIENISKVGGTTDCHSLFENHQEIEQLLSSVKKAKLYQKYGMNQVSDPSLLQIIQNRIKNLIKKKMKKKNISSITDPYVKEEALLKQCLCLLYLDLFEKIYLSGEYDESFSGESFAPTLAQMMAN